jgi:hypothetical protein
MHSPLGQSHLDSSMGTSSEADEEEVLQACERSRDVDRMTARQRSKHDSSYIEDLMVLPEGVQCRGLAVRTIQTLILHCDKLCRNI